MTADDLARAFHAAYTSAVDPKQPGWDGMQSKWRRDKVAAFEAMVADGWVFTPPE